MKFDMQGKQTYRLTFFLVFIFRFNPFFKQHCESWRWSIQLNYPNHWHWLKKYMYYLFYEFKDYIRQWILAFYEATIP